MTAETPTADAKARALAIRDWRHPYVIGGQRVQLSQARFEKWHQWRWGVDRPILQQALGGFAGKSVLDVACNDGWYGFEAEKEGATVVGVEGRDDAFARANLLKAAMERTNISFRKMDIEDPDGGYGGPFDATLFYGILYHLSDPARVLARLGAVTKRIICVQTFVHASDRQARLYLFREDTALPGAALRPLITRPTALAVAMMLKSAGFDHVYRVSPPGSPKRSDRNWVWSFFYGVKGEPLISMKPIEVEAAPIRSRVKRWFGGLQS